MSGTFDSARKTYSSNHIVANGDNRKVAIGKLDAEFAGTGAHEHSGVSGDGTKVSAANLANFNNFSAEFQEFTKDTVSGTTTVVTTQLSGKTPGGATAAAGVITTAPDNRCVVQNKETETNIEDAEGQKVYGRITESAGVWTLSFYTNEAGTETAHSLTSQNIRVFFVEVFTAGTKPTIPSNVGKFGSLDFTADIVDASTTQRGAVSIIAQAWAGLKTFLNGLATNRSDVATTATIASLANTGSYVKLTGSTATSIQGVLASTDGKRVVIWNGSSAVVTLEHQNGSASAADRIISPTGTGVALQPNNGAELIYDSNQSRWVFASTSGGSGSGGAATAEWYLPDNTADIPASTECSVIGLENLVFGFTDDQYVYAQIPIPMSHISGVQIFLKNGLAYNSATSGNFLLSATTYIIKAGIAGLTLPTGYASTNAQQATSGTGNLLNDVTDLDLTDSSGNINSVAVAGGDTLLVRLKRNVSGETSGVQTNLYVPRRSFKVVMT